MKVRGFALPNVYIQQDVFWYATAQLGMIGQNRKRPLFKETKLNRSLKGQFSLFFTKSRYDSFKIKLRGLGEVGFLSKVI